MTKTPEDRRVVVLASPRNRVVKSVRFGRNQFGRLEQHVAYCIEVRTLDALGGEAWATVRWVNGDPNPAIDTPMDCALRALFDALPDGGDV